MYIVIECEKGEFIGAFVSTDLTQPTSSDDYAWEPCGDSKSFLCSFDQGAQFMAIEGLNSYVNLARDYEEGGYMQFGTDGAFYLSFCPGYSNACYRTSQYTCTSNPSVKLPESYIPVKLEVWGLDHSATKKNKSASSTSEFKPTSSQSNISPSESSLKYHCPGPVYEISTSTTISMLSQSIASGRDINLKLPTGNAVKVDSAVTLDNLLSSSMGPLGNIIVFHVADLDQNIQPSQADVHPISPMLKVFRFFVEQGGAVALYKQAKSHIAIQFSKSEQQKWISWIELVSSWSVVPSFTEYFMGNDDCRKLLLFCLGIDEGSTDNLNQIKEDPTKCVLASVCQLLQAEGKAVVRQTILDNHLLDSVLDQLRDVSKEVTRSQNSTADESIMSTTSTSTSPQKSSKHKKSKSGADGATPAKKGVGYGSDELGGSLATKWDPSIYLKAEEQRSQRLEELVNILVAFVSIPESEKSDSRWIAGDEFATKLLGSALLPMIESRFFNDSLLDMGKSAGLYFVCLKLIRALATHDALLNVLDDIDPSWKPVQRESIASLLKKQAGLSRIFMKCLDQAPGVAAAGLSKSTDDSTKLTGASAPKKDILSTMLDDTSITLTKSVAKTDNLKESANTDGMEVLAKDFIATCEFVSQRLVDTVLERQASMGYDRSSISESRLYHLSLRDHRFGYSNMKGKDKKYVHHYEQNIASSSSKPPQTKIVRLAQELAGIATALPVEDTNAIFLRVDESRVDVIKTLIIGATGTPYAGGCFEFHVFCDDSYPNKSPKVNLETTGSGEVRFNPNLYNCGKVCLSLLGTWRGTATENWDPKLSTMLQVFCSIQAMLMSDDVYTNEPGKNIVRF